MNQMRGRTIKNLHLGSLSDFFAKVVWPETRFLGYIRSTLEVHLFDFILGVITGGGRIKHVRVLLGVPTLQILRFKKKKKVRKGE